MGGQGPLFPSPLALEQHLAHSRCSVSVYQKNEHVKYVGSEAKIINTSYSDF